MEGRIDPGIVALFGSETRAATLGALASAGQPLTAYRIARITGAQVVKTVTELRRLERAGFVAEAPTDRERTGWVLVDPRLRDFLRRRVRIVWSVDWDRAVEGRIRSRKPQLRPRIDLSRFVPNPRGVPNPDEFVRAADKDRILSRLGLPVSRRSKTRR